MPHSVPPRKSEPVSIPSWLIKTVTSVLVTAMITGAIAWASNQTSQLNTNIQSVVALKAKTESITTSIEDIKKTENRIEDKLDRILEKSNEPAQRGYRYWK